MIAVILFIIIICSGSIYCALYHRRRFEEIMPITAIGTVLIVFVFGVIGQLKFGVIACISLAAALYIMSAVKLVRDKNWNTVKMYIFTPAFCIFLLAGVVFVIGDMGKQANLVDEFSHWADTVKIMTYLDDFGTHPEARANFPSYLPGMSIFQYILQKLICMVEGKTVFSEWHLYFAFQMFIVILLLPFLKNTDFKDVMSLITWCVALFVAPLMVGRFMYRDIYIDPFMGLLSGVGLSMVLVWKQKDLFYSITIWLLCAMSILSKNIGTMFGIFLFIAYTADILLTKKNGNPKGVWKRKISMISICFAFTMIPKWLWQWEMHRANVASTATKGIDILGFIQVLLGKGTEYHTQIFQIYKNLLCTEGMKPGYIPYEIPFVAVMAMIIVLYGVLYAVYAKKEPEMKTVRGIVLSISVLQMVIYVVGLCMLYMYRFDEYEALNMIAAKRYLQMEILSNWVVIIILSVTAILRWVTGRTVCILAVVTMLAISPVKELYNVAARIHVRNSQKVRRELEPLKYLTDTWCDIGDNVCVISQQPIDDGLIARFNIRPSNYIYPGILTANESDAEGKSVYTKEALQNMWRNKCDYVLIFHLNEEFCTEYGELFAQPNQIEENAVYHIDEVTGLLTKCQ